MSVTECVLRVSPGKNEIEILFVLKVAQPPYENGRRGAMGVGEPIVAGGPFFCICIFGVDQIV